MTSSRSPSGRRICDPLVHQVRDNLFEEQRIALGSLEDAAGEVRIEVASRHQLLGKGLGMPFVQGFEHDG